MHKIGLNNFKGGGVGFGGGVRGGVRGGGWAGHGQSLLWLWVAFCSVRIFHNQKMHFYLIFIFFKFKNVTVKA